MASPSAQYILYSNLPVAEDLFCTTWDYYGDHNCAKDFTR